MNNNKSTSATGNGGSLNLPFLPIIRRHKLAAVAAFAFGIALTLLSFATATRHYESEAKLFVKMGRQSVTLDPTANTGQQISVRESQNQEVFTVQELFSSRKLAEAVVERIGADVIEAGAPLDGNDEESFLPSPGDLLRPLETINLNPLRVYSETDEAVETFQKNLTILAGKQTNVISFAYESEDPGHSRDVLTALIDLGRDEHLRMHSIRGSQAFFVQQADLLRGNLDELEEELNQLKSETGIASLETQRSNHLGLLNSLRERYLTIHADLAGLSEEIAERRTQQARLPETIVFESTTDQPQTVNQSLRERLFELEMREEELVSRYRETHPRLIQMRKQIAATRAIASQENKTPEVKTGVNENFQATQLAILEREGRATAMKTTLTTLEREIEQAEAKLVEINTAEIGIRRLEREIELATLNYRTYAGNLEQARIDREINSAGISSLNPVQDPTFVETPSSPKASISLGLGFIMSTVFAMFAAFASEQRQLNKNRSQPAPVTSSSQATPKPRVIAKTRIHGPQPTLVSESAGPTSWEPTET